MIEAGFTEYLLGALALLLLIAAVVDVATLTISNRLNLAVAVMAPLFWWSADLPISAIAAQLATAGGVFILLAAAFHFGMMGGGDVKLAAALALWFPPLATAGLLVLMSLAGGVLTLALLGVHRMRGKVGRPAIPYGVAIAFGGLAILAQRFLNQFA